MRNLMFFLAVIFLIACKQAKKDRDIIGRYINTYEIDAVHYVDLRADNTFLHYYKKMHNEAKVNEGKWEQASDSEIAFREWVTFGFTGPDACFKCLWIVKVSNGELVFNSDIREEMNFKKR